MNQSSRKEPWATALDLAQKYHWWPNVHWQAATGAKRWSSESIFLEAAGHALSAVHADIGLNEAVLVSVVMHTVTTLTTESNYINCTVYM